MNSLQSPRTATRLRDRVPSTTALFVIAWHTAAVLAVGVLLAAPFVRLETLATLWSVAQVSGFSYLFGSELVLHLGISACLWAAIYLGFIATREALRGLRGARVVTARGSVMTETLIVMPVALLLTFGLAQLAVVNMAGILTNLATFEAARAVWLWLPEAQVERRGVNRNKVVDMARIQAAAAVTPVAPGDYQLSPDVGTEAFQQARAMFVASQMQSPPNDSGRLGHGLAMGYAQSTGNASGPDLAFWRSFDSTIFSVRTARKFTFAYLATEVEIVDHGEHLGARVVYKHLCGFPVVNQIFGNRDQVGDRSAFYSRIVREYVLPRQVLPNARTPHP